MRQLGEEQAASGGAQPTWLAAGEGQRNPGAVGALVALAKHGWCLRLAWLDIRIRTYGDRL